MRKRQTFLLTVLTAENGSASFCGQIKVISSGKTCNFTSLDELYRLIASEMGEDVIERFTKFELSRGRSENPLELP